MLFASSRVFAAFAILQIVGLAISIAGLRYRIPLLDRVASPASAMLVLNVAAVAGLYKFLFTRGPLWKIWNSNRPSERELTPEPERLPTPETAAVAPVIGIGKSVYNDSHQ
jgi:hypothetical protein